MSYNYTMMVSFYSFNVPIIITRIIKAIILAFPLPPVAVSTRPGRETLSPERLGFRCNDRGLGFRVRGLGVRVLGQQDGDEW